MDQHEMLRGLRGLRGVRGLVGVCAALALLAGCDDADGGNDGGASNGDCTPVVAVGESIYRACADTFELEVAGDGYQNTPAPGSECHGEQRYRLTLATRTLDWTICSASHTDPWRKSEGDRVLSQTEHADAVAALKKVVVSDSEACGADKATTTVTIDTAVGEQTYTDDFYSCVKEPPFVANIDAARIALDRLAREPVTCCAALPVCAEDEESYETQQTCEQSADGCNDVSLCCDTIWCGKPKNGPPLCCQAYPTCAAGETSYDTKAECRANARSCASVNACCSTIWCGDANDEDAGTDDAG